MANTTLGSLQILSCIIVLPRLDWPTQGPNHHFFYSVRQLNKAKPRTDIKLVRYR